MIKAILYCSVILASVWISGYATGKRLAWRSIKRVIERSAEQEAR